jgi:hypothetical protein
VLKALHPFRVVLLLKEAQTKDIKCVLDLKNGTSRLASIEDLEKEAVSIPFLELKSEDLVIQQMEQGKSWLAVYPEKLDPEKEQERRLFELNCELLIALQGSSGLIGVMGLGKPKSDDESVAYSLGLMNGISAPYLTAISAISSSSVDTITRSMLSHNRAAVIE